MAHRQTQLGGDDNNLWAGCIVLGQRARRCIGGSLSRKHENKRVGAPKYLRTVSRVCVCVYIFINRRCASIQILLFNIFESFGEEGGNLLDSQLMKHIEADQIALLKKKFQDIASDGAVASDDELFPIISSNLGNLSSMLSRKA